MSHSVNIVRLKGVYNALGALQNSVAFVGGATVSLYADKPSQMDVRPTNDVDVLIEIASYYEYAKVQEKLAALGFQVDTSSKVICRYKYQGLTVDIMPTEENILGFNNRWYKDGFANLQAYTIDERTQINIFTTPYFIASKIEAYKSRGKSDGRTSQDFEDIVFVLDNRKTVWQEIENTPDHLNKYLAEEFSKLLAHPYLEEWVSAHLEYETATERAELMILNIKRFTNQ